MLTSTGIIKTSNQDNIYKLIVEVDQEIVRYYSWFILKKYNLQRQRYSPHITVIRENKFVDFNQFNNQLVNFQYSGDIFVGDMYAWLNVTCDYLLDLRKYLGLSGYDWYTKPPDGSDGFHITLGNFKHLYKK